MYGTTVKELVDNPIVRGFLDVFPNDLPGLPPNRDVDFVIELKPSTALVSRRAYRMPLKELAEHKIHCRSCLTKVMSDPVHHHGVVLLSL